MFSLLSALLLLLLSESLRLIINFNYSLSICKFIFISLIVKTWVYKVKELTACNKFSIISALYYFNFNSIIVFYKTCLIEVNKSKVVRLIWTHLSVKIHVTVTISKDSNYKINNL